MSDPPIISDFSHNKPDATAFVSDGLRDFFLYRDLGIKAATGGRVIAHLVRANAAPEKGTGSHIHEADFQIVYMMKGWARFMYEDKDTLVSAGDCVHQRPGVVHYLYDYPPDMEYLGIVSPADFGSVEVEGPAPCQPPRHGRARTRRRARPVRRPLSWRGRPIPACPELPSCGRNRLHIRHPRPHRRSKAG